MISFIAFLMIFLITTNEVTAGLKIRQKFKNRTVSRMDESVMDKRWTSLIKFTEDFSFYQTLINPYMKPESDISFALFTEDGEDPVMLKINDFETLDHSNFCDDYPTKIIIHGWTDSSKSMWVRKMVQYYVTSGNYNVIAVDWSVISTSNYVLSAKLTKQVANYTAQFLDYIVSKEFLTLDNVHILGHSLGAHIAGFIGKIFGGKIGRITGMDPARPGFEIPRLRSMHERLDMSDAKFVDVIHTCIGTVGFLRAIGHVDFYPNGGFSRQPGCSVLLQQTCSHGRSHEFMTESIVRPRAFPAVLCKSWILYKLRKCKRNRIAHMGEHVEINESGTFFFKTNKKFPFGRSEP